MEELTDNLAPHLATWVQRASKLHPLTHQTSRSLLLYYYKISYMVSDIEL
jgi:hypothetical protein